MRNLTTSPVTDTTGLAIQLIDPATGEMHKHATTAAIAGDLISTDAGNSLIEGTDGKLYNASTALFDDDQVLTGDNTTNTTVTLTPTTVTDPDNPAVNQTNYTIKAEVKIDGTTIVQDPVTKVLRAVAPAPFKEANRWYVDPNGNDTNTGANEAPKLTAQAAVDALTANDTAVLNEGTYAAVTMSVQNTALAGASSTYGSLTQIAAVTVATASGTSNKISDLTVTGNLARTGNAPLYVNNTTVGGNVTLAGTAYTEIRDSSIQDGSITVSGASTLLIEDSKIGTSTFNTAGSAIALRNVTIDAGDTVTFGPGVVYSLSGTTGTIVKDPAAINVEDALVAAGLSAALAEGAVTTHFHHIRMHNADLETSPTQVVTRDPVTGELEYSPLSAIAPNETTGYGTAAPTVAGTVIGSTFYVTPLGTAADAANATAAYRWDGTQWVKYPVGGGGGSTTTAPIHERDVKIATAGMTSHTLPDTPVGKVIVTRNGVDISDSWTWVDGVGTYSSAANFGCVLDAGDKLEFHYEKEGTEGGGTTASIPVKDDGTEITAGMTSLNVIGALTATATPTGEVTIALDAIHGVDASFQQGQSVPSGAATYLTNMTTVSNTAGGAWDASLGEFTVQRAGWYTITAALHFEAGNTAANTSEVLWLMKNGGLLRGTSTWHEVAVTGVFKSASAVTTSAYLSIGDKIRTLVVQDGGSTRTIGNALRNFFNIVENR
jgi:hypothetical protein